MSHYLAEFIGTAILILLGDGVVANVVLKKTKGNDSGWIVITLGWAVAVVVPAMIFGNHGGAVFNPALTIALAVTGAFEWSVVPGYIAAQMAGAFVGACLVWLMYKDHFDATEDGDSKLAVFSTGPAIRSNANNFISEVIGTFILVFAIMGISQTFIGDNVAPGVNLFGVGAIILTCGMSLGGTTGYAINPARDLGPRIAHFILPIKNKRNSDWSYSWIPVLGPIVGAVLAAFLNNALFA
jgi:Glycerol uptake facilitator and related permeases (Major Intrinsic Protein Family)